MLETDPAVTCASAGAISPPVRPLAKLSAPIRKISVMKLNASVNGGTFQAPMNTLASAACRIVEKNDASTIQTITSASQSGCRNSDRPAPTRMPLKPNSPARIAPRSMPRNSAVAVDTARPSAPAKPSHGSPMNIATRIASPVTGLFMKQTCPMPRRQESTKSSSGFACARSAHAGIVPLIDRPGGEPPPEVLIGNASSGCAHGARTA